MADEVSSARQGGESGQGTGSSHAGAAGEESVSETGGAIGGATGGATGGARPGASGRAFPTASTGTASAEIGQLLSDPALGARRFRAAEGTALYEADAPARHLFVIHEGQVRIFQAGPKQLSQLVEILGPGDWFGVPSLARRSAAPPAGGSDGHPGEGRYGMRAAAFTAAEISEVPADRVLDALSRRPEAAVAVIAQLAAKLQAAYGHAANLVFDDTEKRLIKALLQFSRSSAATRVEAVKGSEEDDEGVVLRITHQQLAQAVGAARETVSLTLTNLRNQNLLRTGRNRLSFKPKALEDFARRSDSTSAQAAQDAG